MGEAYTAFASVYDEFMDETPYQEWAEWIRELLEEYGPEQLPGTAGQSGEAEEERQIVVDLGCGTGSLTELLAAAGYDMIGVDSSQEMLGTAIAKREQSGHNILYLCQDLRELELYGTAGAMVSVCDSLNYILEEEELETVFRLVNNYLYPGGILIFDFNTVYKYETVIGDTTIAENREDCSFIWENYYDSSTRINEYDLTLFVRQEDGGFQRFQETHYQRGYLLEEIKALLAEAGMEFVTAMDGDSRQAVTGESQRILVVARESGKGV